MWVESQKKILMRKFFDRVIFFGILMLNENTAHRELYLGRENRKKATLQTMLAKSRKLIMKLLAISTFFKVSSHSVQGKKQVACNGASNK